MVSRQKLIKTTLPALLCVMALFVAACGGGINTPASTTKAATSKQVFILPEVGVPDIATFDPGLSTDAPSLTAIDMVFTGLVQLDDNGNVKGYLASSWDESADHLTYTFH
ncbi:MAG TPA: peptide ABC transporter substrate-binding protein, partial [Ktedonobacteraceae bacterium]|nr:peptide ABC transporter substrate-binding protein [Ktedonobacteraceae bacterium]